MFTKKTADSNSVCSAEGSCSTCSTASSRPAKNSPPEVLRAACLGKRPKALRTACLGKHPSVGLAVVFRYAAICLALLLVCLCALSLMYPQSTYAVQGSDPLTVTVEVEGFQGSLPTLIEGNDFTKGQAIQADPRYMVDSQGNQPLASLIEEKESQGFQLVWKTDASDNFDWFTTPITQSTTVKGSFVEADYIVRVSFNDEKTEDIEVAIPKGSSFEEAYGKALSTPSKQGYTFIRWVNSSDNSTFDFSAPVEASTTIYALYSISEPDQVVTVDADFDVPETASGKCYIGATWSVHPAQFSISGFTGELEGCSGTGSCSLPSAAAPSYTWADYNATLVSVDINAGIVTYDVTITPPGAASPNGPRNSLGLIGYQTVYFQAKVQKNFGGYLELKKASENPSLSESNSTYSLEGAIFGVYDKNGNRVAQLQTDENGQSQRSPLLPVGTYTIKEEQAPAGFANTADKSIPIHAGSVTQSTISNTPQSCLIDLVLQKVDAETKVSSPLGSATLGGAQFQVSYYDRYLTVPQLVQNTLTAFMDGEEAQSNQLSIPQSWGNPVRSWIFETDEEGKIHFSKDYFVEGDDFYYDHEGSIVLPLGTVEIKEIKAPEGYLPVENTFVVSLNESGTEPHIENWEVIEISEQVKRGDFAFSKTRQGSMERLASVPFRITSKTTRESHVLVTDENGMASTESSWTPHSQNTNKGTSADDGIWFGQDALGTQAPVDDNLGALPYDTYTVEELPCSTNEGMVPVAFEITISRDKTTLDLGTVDNKPYTPEIKGEIDKRQTLFKANGLFTYTIDYRSTSSTWADEFTTTDFLTCSKEDQAHLEALTTPISSGDYDGKMNVWYQTNMTNTPAQEKIQDAENNEQKESETTEQTQESESTQESETAIVQESESTNAQENETANACSTNPYNPDNPNNERMYNFDNWRLWSQDLSTQESTTLFVEDLQLKEGEYITALAFEHGRVEEGFGTLSQEDEQWNRRERYENNDTLENAFDSTELSSWNNETCSQVLDALYQEKTVYAPAVLFMKATDEMLQSEDIELWNDARIDIYRNLELHDEDKDSVVQTTVQYPTNTTDNPIEKLLTTLPKTEDLGFGIVVSLIAIGTLAGAIVVSIKIRNRKSQR
ncbi:putative uncharacterized protein [Cryptobacterium sp. CAG:338]|nr:putative uncharacterized protein [Cryptobacterium sp. CAG:338]